MPKRGRTPVQRSQRLAVWFLTVVVLVAAAAFLLSLARVRVRITPQLETIVVDRSLTIVGSGPAGEGAMEGRLVRVEGTGSGLLPPLPPAVTFGPPALRAIPTPGATPARGTVTLVNTHTSPQPLVATTRLLSRERVLFRLKQRVVIPARGRREGVPVYADQSGEQGNIGPTTFIIPGLSTWLQERVRAESTTSMTGGSGVLMPLPPALQSPQSPKPSTRTSTTRRPAPQPETITDAHLASVREQATTAAREDALARARALARSGEETVVVGEVVRAEVPHTSGASYPATGLRGSATVTITAILVPKDAIAQQARAALEEQARASGRTLVRVRPDSLRTRIIRQDAATARVTLTVHAEGDAVLAAGRQVFDPRRIAGFDAGAVQTYLRSIPGIRDVEVQFWPFWVRRVPSNVGTVEVEVQEPTDSSSRK